VYAPAPPPYHAPVERRRDPSLGAGDPTDRYLNPTPAEGEAEPEPLFEATGEEVEAPPYPPPEIGQPEEAKEGVAATREAQAVPNAALLARSEPDAEAESAETATASTPSRRARFSPDGEWWWNGASWLAAVSNDGLWRWDGTDWLLRVDSGLEPERLVDDLDKLADVHYRRGGLLLARHANDWPVPPDLTQPVAEATKILEQRVATERRLQDQTRRMGELLPHVTARQRLRVKLGNIDARLEPRLLRIGREAPVPTCRGADEALETARHLTTAAREVTAAHEAVLAAQADWQKRVAAAMADLERCSAERDARIAQAEVGVREAEARRELRIADAWRELAEVRMPHKGEHLASFGPIHLFAGQIEMPNVAGPASGAAPVIGSAVEPTAGARAAIGSAAELTEAEPGPLDELFLVGDSGAAALHQAEASGDPTPYLLVITESRSVVISCGQNEGDARRFARQVAAAADTAEAMREVRRARLAEAKDAVQQADDDHSEIEAANAHRGAAEQDPELLRAIERAQDQLTFERGETTELDHTGAELQGVLERLTTPPVPLPAADSN
jgi:hypothetical protein